MLEYIEQVLQEFESDDAKLIILQEVDKRWSGIIEGKTGEYALWTTKVGESLEDLFETLNAQCEEYLSDYDA